MKKSLCLYAFVIFVLTSCDSAEPLADGVLLASVEHDMGDQSWLELYEYNDEGQLISVEDQSGLGRKKIFIYDAGRLLETRTIRLDNDELIFRDSLVYNAAGQLVNIYNFSVNIGAGVPLNEIKSLTYNSLGQLREVSSAFVNLGDHNPRDVYTWKDGNVIQVDRYDGTALQQEFYLVYDNKVGLNLESFSFLGHPEAATKNNVISTDWKDYTGLLDTVCKPCTVSYQYSSNGVPASLTTNWSYSATFTYKELPQASGF